MRVRLLAAAASTLLLPVAVPTAATAAPGRTAVAPDVPCPRVAVPAPAPTRPPRPTPPPAVAEDREVGGPALATAGLAVPPGAPRPPGVTATSWLVADLDTGQVLGACGAHEYATPASVQKLLLAAAVLPRLDPEQVVTVTREDLDIEPGSSAVGLVAGGRYRVETVWLGLLLQSGNEAANVLARLGGGAEGRAGGVRAMNELARHLGARQTHAVTPSGLDGRGQFTSAYDLALIARVCFADPTFQRYALTGTHQIPAQSRPRTKGFQIQNENPLIRRYPGALGGKTGFTDLARHTYVGAAERNGRRLVVTLLGAESRPARGWEQGAALLDWGFAQPRDAAVGRLVEPGELDAAASNASPAPEGAAARPVAGGEPLPEGLTGPGPLIVAAVAGVAGLLTLVVRSARSPRRRRGRRRA
ncbi:D-alanyl-D-alanine carboxypeptidase family protein [Micromonospora thermarum]|uniref:D-alanyl-D-alanine carboxypeptidase n=1 Tax=Micromonospora thermarum TaxID=2720024 RepID=A0ABX0Z157_9ACTN|nr:serine hydrolase [Micromonospora thermarum]NJP30933.1 D-alanyl-D-alanine carboxypeptidase [Micromonospora thermarum]